MAATQQATDQITTQAGYEQAAPRLTPIELSDGSPMAHIPPRGRNWEAMHPKAAGLFTKVVDGELPWPLTLIGLPGTGKTCAALCLLDRVIASRIYTTAEQWCERVTPYSDVDRDISPGEWWRSWADARITCMDELGARERVSDFQYATVKRAIDERMDKAAVWISNLPVSELESVYDRRITSRLAAGTVITFDGPDRRQA